MNIVSEAEKYVTGLFAGKHREELAYHNIDHTRSVVEAAGFIGKQCGVNGVELEMLLVAAWFHDTGYLSTKENHEDISRHYARKFLMANHIGHDFIDEVERCIEATRIPQNPDGKLAAILCDADLFQVSQDSFLENAQFFWNELFAFSRKKLDHINYLDITYRFFKDHHFRTEYGKNVLAEGKEKNMKKLLEMMNALGNGNNNGVT